MNESDKLKKLLSRGFKIEGMASGAPGSVKILLRSQTGKIVDMVTSDVHLICYVIGLSKI